ncbi:acyl-CoA dehydrogenase [Crenobacter sp. SG2303]|uniref:Acyl-CoA dehydrogenase n=1 Tax=Crenobacter oryzisoli TaxID=3056844 RepID=A0ABT7XNH6_9NEIS|nr:acyl-CoA dehydrogenase [Crenobacter sp. SG2303]MDN0075290.1 acyl-CoA dehydrogenase [Crenobacter sp. SG2303]
MSNYTAPVRDMLFVMNELAGLDAVGTLPGYEEASADLAEAILEEAGRFAGEVIAPLNVIGDREGSRLIDGKVVPPTGFADAYRQFVDGGWGAVASEIDHGGQGLPQLLAKPVTEMWNSANLSFALCPMLTQGALEALEHHGSDELKAVYLSKLATGEWTGTMNLTEPQAGSDLAAVRTKAVPEGDHYRISGNKIFITWGEHDMTDNIVHLVLARLPDAPEGVKGISLFVVPKYLVNADGSLGLRNDVQCVSLEHKMGIHGSPTAVLAFGEKDGAIGYLVGEPNRGLEYMFTMMNHARLGVGLEGVAISERAYQQARDYARDRVQGKAIGQRAAGAIIKHPDVRRMLMLMKSQTEAMRALAYVTAAYMDQAARHPDPVQRAYYQARVDLLTPVVKGWSTETAQEVTSLGVQVHGGMGFIEETGAAQHMRDARIITIYEGTTGIQANDLLGRKTVREEGKTLQALIEEIRADVARVAELEGEAFRQIAAGLEEALRVLEATASHLIATAANDMPLAFSGAVPYLMQLGIVCGGWQMARAACIAKARLDAGDDVAFHQAKIVSAQFYATHVLPRAQAHAHAALHGGQATLALDESAF